MTLAQECKFTIIGKFYGGKPTMEEIRKVFISKFHLTGSVKIAYFDFRHVYIDFTNEVDFNHIRFKEFIEIGDAPIEDLEMDIGFQTRRRNFHCPNLDSNSSTTMAFIQMACHF